MSLADRLLHVSCRLLPVLGVQPEWEPDEIFQAQLSTDNGNVVVTGGDVAMRSVVRVVKRGEREGANNSQVGDGSRAVQESTPEMIIKSWIAASRERRSTQAADRLRDFKRWKQEVCLLEAQ
jgi:hypothetical protein